MLVQTFDYLNHLTFEGYVHDDGDTKAILRDVQAFLDLESGCAITLSGGPRRLSETHGVVSGGRFIRAPYTFGTLRERIQCQQEQRRRSTVTQIPRTKPQRETA